jgi:DNA-directed RNA polymerase specialized sigma24 family protein
MANEYCTANVPYIGDKREDLVSSLVEVGLLAATRYDPAKTNGGDHFEGWLCKIMTHRCKDFFRKKSEGFGDRRYGNDNRIFLAGDTLDDAPDSDVDFGELISQRRLARWQAAAKLTEWSFEEFIAVTLDRAASELERSAA